MIKDKSEFSRALAIWAIEDGFDELKPKPYPFRPPKVVEFFSLPKEKRKHMNENPEKYSKFWTEYEVSKYFDDCAMVKNVNRANKEWLLDYKRWLKPGLDDAYINKIDQRLLDFDIIQMGIPDVQDAGWTE